MNINSGMAFNIILTICGAILLWAFADWKASALFLVFVAPFWVWHIRTRKP
jgi:hypothetical protein